MMSALSQPTERPRAAEPLVEIKGLTKLYQVDSGWLGKKRSWLSALEDVDLTVRRGEILALVGESGSGKSTLARLLIKLIEPTRGEVRYEGQNIFGLSRAQVRRLRRKVQIVFQDPYSSLNPRHNVAQIVSEGINDLAAPARRKRTRELLDLVGLSPNIIDEPVSALDVSVQSKILNLLADLRDSLQLTYVLISHDLGIVRHIADRVAVMYLGHLVEVAPKHLLFSTPRHPYTQALLSAVPMISNKRQKRSRIILAGEIPTAIDIPARCRFATRCFRAIDVCWKEIPRLKEVEREHLVACFNHAPLAEALSR